MLALVANLDGRVIQISDVSFQIPSVLSWIALPPELESYAPAQLHYTGSGFEIVPLPEPTPPEGVTRWPVLKSTIRSRLRSAGLEATADAARATLPDSMQRDWEDALVIASDDQRVIDLLEAIEANPMQILAFDPAAAMFQAFI